MLELDIEENPSALADTFPKSKLAQAPSSAEQKFVLIEMAGSQLNGRAGLLLTDNDSGSHRASQAKGRYVDVMLTENFEMVAIDSIHLKPVTCAREILRRSVQGVGEERNTRLRELQLCARWAGAGHLNSRDHE